MASSFAFAGLTAGEVSVSEPLTIIRLFNWVLGPANGPVRSVLFFFFYSPGRERV